MYSSIVRSRLHVGIGTSLIESLFFLLSHSFGLPWWVSLCHRSCLHLFVSSSSCYIRWPLLVGSYVETQYSMCWIWVSWFVGLCRYLSCWLDVLFLFLVLCTEHNFLLVSWSYQHLSLFCRLVYPIIHYLGGSARLLLWHISSSYWVEYYNRHHKFYQRREGSKLLILRYLW